MFISKKNEVYLILSNLELSTSQEISEFFTFEVPGAKFMPMYRNRMWDGKIRLFSPGTGEIYVGLLPYIKEFCSRNKIKYTIEEGVEDTRPVVRQVVKGFIKSLKPKSKGKSLKIRDYQIAAVHHAISNNRALLVSPTASGKSLIIYSLIRYYHMMGLKTLILVPTTSLVEQMYSDFEDYGWGSGTYCQKIYQGYDRKVTKDVVISTWQSIYKMPKKYFEQFGCVIGDEAHLFKSKSLVGIMGMLHHAKYRFGFTGTLDGTQTHKWVLEGLFGPSYQVTQTKDLIEQGHLSQLDIQCVVLKYTPKKFDTYEDEIQFLISHEKRNKFLCNLALDLKGNTLMLYSRVETHGKVLYEMINKNVTHGRKVFFIHGGVDAEDRESVRKITEEENNAIIVASYGTFSTGINIKNLHNVIFASPSKSRIRNLQSIGRVLRKGKNKTKAKLYDIADDLTKGSRKNYTLNHFIERVKIYVQEQFNYEITSINIKD